MEMHYHHDAAEDARVAGEIQIHAIQETGLSIDEWLIRSRQPINGKPDKLTRDGNPEDLKSATLQFRLQC
jgi:hypothetical protein